jgi:6-phosphogluconolactonase
VNQKKAALYANVGPVLMHYDLDVDGHTLIKRGSIKLPDDVQYAWPHASKPILYVACGCRPTLEGKGSGHAVCALKIDEATGELSMHGKPQPLPRRPIHITTDSQSRHVLVCSNVPSGLWVFRIEADGTLGGMVPQRPDMDLGIFPHQMRITADNRMAILVTRGIPLNKTFMPYEGNQQDPGGLKVFEYRDGVLGKEVSIASGDGYRFGPRHLDFHPTGPWVYVSLETQNKLHVYKRDGDTLAAEPLFTRDTLAGPAHTRQLAGTVHVHPYGHTVYGVNRAHMPQPFEGKEVIIGADNTLAVYSIDQATGEPNAIQHIDAEGICPRAFALDPSARMLVAGNSEPRWVRQGDQVRWVPPSLAVFKVLEDGRLEFKRKYEIEPAPHENLSWMGIVAY